MQDHLLSLRWHSAESRFEIKEIQATQQELNEEYCWVQDESKSTTKEAMVTDFPNDTSTYVLNLLHQHVQYFSATCVSGWAWLEFILLDLLVETAGCRCTSLNLKKKRDSSSQNQKFIFSSLN